MNTVFAEYETVAGLNSVEGSIKVLIAPTTDDENRIRFNIAQMVDGECKANVCALMDKETVELFAHHLTSQCVCTSLNCECGGVLEVL